MTVEELNHLSSSEFLALLDSSERESVQQLYDSPCRVVLKWPLRQGAKDYLLRVHYYARRTATLGPCSTRSQMDEWERQHEPELLRCLKVNNPREY